jgi:hypothetical protein
MTSRSKRKIQRNPVVSSAPSVVFNGISLVMQSNSKWFGTMTQLSWAISRVLNPKQRNLLPKSPSALRLAVNQVVNRLRNQGIGVRFGRTTDHSRTRFVKFSR